MTEREENPGNNTDIKSNEKPIEGSNSAKDASSDKVKILPTLVGYFAEDSASPSAFFKALRKDNIKLFRSTDQKEAAELMLTKDPEFERLWVLMAQASPPRAVDAWMWGAAQSRIKEQLGDAFDAQDYNAGRVLKSILNQLELSLKSENKEEKKRAENLLRVAICWLVEKRSLKTWQVAEQVIPVFFKNINKATEVAQRIVQKGKLVELKNAAAMVALGDQMVKAAEKDYIRARDISNDLRSRLDDAKEKIEKLCLELENAKETISDHKAKLDELGQTLADERHHWGHDMTETKAEQKVLLGKRLGPLLTDAIDALEIEEPKPEIALRRIRTALSVIEGAK